jgi:hypothetical protein
MGSTWTPVDLAAVVEKGYTPPRPGVCMVVNSEFGLFYEGRINALFGDSGGGKTWVALWTIKEAIEQKRSAVLIDYEDHPGACIQRLEQLGCERSAILQYLIYVQPHEKWNPAAEKHLLAGLDGRNAAVAVFDSTGEGMALDGVNPNSDDEVARWFRGAARCLADHGAAVILIDHVPKPQQGGRTVDFQIGSQRKRAAVNGAAYYLDVISAPSREEEGRFKLWTKKCRFGWRKHGMIACEVSMSNNEDGTINFSIVQPEPESAKEAPRFTWTMQKLSEWLQQMNQPVSWRQAREAPVGKQGGKPKRVVVDAALVALRDEGYIKWPKGQKIEHVKPYREAEDDQAVGAVQVASGVVADPF